MDSMETTIVVGIAVAAAVAVAMEEDVVDTTPISPLSMMITASYHSSLP